MKRKDFLKLKAGLLCNGVKITDDAKKELLSVYPHFFNKGFIHAANISVFGSNICVSVADGYSANSQFTLCRSGNDYKIMYKEKIPAIDINCITNTEKNSKSQKNSYQNGQYKIIKVPVKFFGALPETGTIIDGMAQLHAPGCINIWPSSACCYDSDGLKCKFCSLDKDRNAPIPADQLVNGIRLLFEKLDKNGVYHPDTKTFKKEKYMLNMSGGTYRSPDHMADYYLDLVKKIRKFSLCDITIELAPPSDLGKLKSLKDSGCNAVIMNIEIADQTLRTEICPGKSRINYDHYHRAMRYAVEIFGHGMVSSVLIGGIQPQEDIIRECELLASEGVFPTIMPFRPFDNCELHGFSPCSPDALVQMSEQLGQILRKYRLSPKKQPGCTECGGCSIENDCYETKEFVF